MNYYYLIAGLPDLNLDSNTSKIDFSETFSTIQRNLAPDDKKLFQYLLFPNDNRNLLNTLFHEYKDFPKRPFTSPSTLTEHDISDYRRQKGSFPNYMSEFLSSNEDQFTSLSMKEMEERLSVRFYEEIYELEAPFIVEYFSFERRLKAVISIYNKSCFDFLSNPNSQYTDDMLGQSGNIKSLPPSLLKEFSFAEKLEGFISTQEPDKIEKLIEEAKWEYLEKDTALFSREKVFSYALKLLILMRKSTLNVEKGSAKFIHLQEDIKRKVRSPKMAIA